MKKPNLISMAELSRLSGRSRQAISKACKEGGLLFPAMVDRKINVNHKSVQEYLQKSRIDSANALKNQKTKKPTPPRKKAKKQAKKKTVSGKKKDKGSENGSENGYHIDIEIEDLEEMTVKEVAMKYGGMPGFKVYIDALKTIAEYKNKAIMAKQKRADLVDRLSMESVSIALIDLAFKRLVTDVPASLSQSVHSTVKAGGKNVIFKIEDLYRKANSKVLKDVKKEILKRMKQLEK